MIESTIRVLSPADSTLWTTVANIRDELGLGVSTGAGADIPLDLQLARRIERASARLLKFLNMKYVAFQQYEEVTPGQPDTILLLSVTPVVVVLEAEFVNVDLEINNTPGADITPEILVRDCTMGSLYRRFAWLWSPLRGSFLDINLTEEGEQFPGMEENNWRFTYEAGWLMPAQTTPVPSSTVGLLQGQIGCARVPFPPDLEQAAVEQVRWDHNRRGGGADSGVSSKHVGDTTISYFSQSQQMNEEHRGLAPQAFHLANPYRRAV